ncbi:hypothetical protein ACLQ25_32855, partial [Micromonospora sp. DT44]|uniref:hypothetical protein n=1 Tax=Micromonospora sp. DT44 TaxID=3393439 RepID=UPI003CE69C79
VIDPPHNQLPANTNSYSYSVAAQSSSTPQDPCPLPEVSQYPAQYGTTALYGVNQPTPYVPPYPPTYTRFADSNGPAFNPAGPSMSHHDYAPTPATSTIQYGNSSVDQQAIS